MSKITEQDNNELKARVQELEHANRLKDNEARLLRKSVHDWKATATRLRDRVFNNGATDAEKMFLEICSECLQERGELVITPDMETVLRLAIVERASACVNRAWNNPHGVQGARVETQQGALSERLQDGEPGELEQKQD